MKRKRLVLYDRSLASWPDKKKLACFIAGNNGIETHAIAISSHSKFNFKCDKCPHTFESALNSVTNKKSPRWCPHCAGQTLCKKKECLECHARSLASWPFPDKLACFIAGNNGIEPHAVAISSNSKFNFKCDKCPHTFESALSNVTNKKSPSWCPHCAGRVCGKEECTTCAPSCIVRASHNISVKGRFTTPLGHMCRECFVHSGFAPPDTRAKVSLEIYMFAELQRLAKDTVHEYVWAEPTAWDCAILPGLAYKPDNIWVFSKHGNVFSVAGACKINTNLVGHVIVLEILEIGIEQHSAARSVPDLVREQEIRRVFSPQLVDFLYVVVAAYNHPTAHPDDQFFSKPAGSFEYELVRSRKAAWTARIKETLRQLEIMHTRREGTTVFIGH